MLTQCKLYNCLNGTLGLHLSRAPWDPYPWVSNVQSESSASNAGIQIGDTIIQLNACDLLGQKISEIAQQLREHWATGASYVSLTIWRNKAETLTNDGDADDDGSAEHANDANEHQHGINQQSLQKFATCLQHIAQLLECPVCLEVIKPPSWQCCNGHVICNNCRSRSVKCPVCRVPLGPRGRCLLADQLFTLLAENFPCDGVKSKKSCSRDKDKCTPEYHNQPKMALEKTTTASTRMDVGMSQRNANKLANNKTMCQREQQQLVNASPGNERMKDKLNGIVIENERQQPQKMSKKKA